MNINLLKDFGMDQEKIRAVKDKIVNSDKFDFNQEEVELIYQYKDSFVSTTTCK